MECVNLNPQALTLEVFEHSGWEGCTSAGSSTVQQPGRYLSKLSVSGCIQVMSARHLLVIPRCLVQPLSFGKKKKPHWTDCSALSAQISCYTSPSCYAVSCRHNHNNTEALKMLLKSEHYEWRWATHSFWSRHEVKLWCSDLPCFVNRGKSYIPRQWDKSAKQGLLKPRKFEAGLKTIFNTCLQYLNTILVSKDREIKAYILCVAKP